MKSIKNSNSSIRFDRRDSVNDFFYLVRLEIRNLYKV